MSGERIAFFGDVQGFSGVYRTALEALGVDVAAGLVPDGLTVVQVGDLIHKGPDSDGVIAMVDRLLRRSPDRYVQLTGNHEGQYLGGPVFWADTIGDDAARTLARWYVDGASRIAWAADTVEHGPVLATHGGLSYRLWLTAGAPEDPVPVARQLNEEFWHDPARALQPGIMLRGETGPPGVAWTEPTRELYPPWIEAGRMPFAQVHGHASPWSWARQRWYPSTSRRLRTALTVDETSRRTELDIGGRSFIGIDTAFSAADTGPIVPFIVTRRVPEEPTR